MDFVESVEYCKTKICKICGDKLRPLRKGEFPSRCFHNKCKEGLYKKILDAEKNLFKSLHQ
jgi:hypothetical protein